MPNEKKGRMLSGRKTNWTRLVGPQRANSSEVRRLTTIPGSQTTTASGSITLRFTNSSVSGAQEWSSYSARYVEARVLSIRVHISPLEPATSISNGTGVFGTDRSGGVASTTFAQVWALQAPKLYTTQMVKPFTYEARAIDLEDQDFSPTSSAPVLSFGINGSFTSLSFSQVALFVLVEYMVEFRGTQ